ncbi:60S ribosomal protein L6-like [Ananas comosus]|uniref:60S ribosomal protein L6-like n=1 Tax=Ananas comosus TaxID=4615 RepID=A0A6P5GNI6_ANACO|nr:60S ribosomal protein L6-like [Ananas comosus]
MVELGTLGFRSQNPSPIRDAPPPPPLAGELRELLLPHAAAPIPTTLRPFQDQRVINMTENQAYTIATSTKFDISGVGVEKFDDVFRERKEVETEEWEKWIH